MIRRILIDAEDAGLIEITPHGNVSGKVTVHDSHMTLDFESFEAIVGMLDSWRSPQRTSMKLECEYVVMQVFGQLPALDELLLAHAIVSADERAERNV